MMSAFRGDPDATMMDSVNGVASTRTLGCEEG